MVRKVAVVTGGNKGIGLEIVKGLCEKFDGDVILTARDIVRGKEAVEELKKVGLNPEFHQLDITNQESLNTFKNFLEKKYGGLDVLVNNAAIAFKNDATEPFSLQAKETVYVNYTCLLNTCKCLFPLLRANARVVNVSSVMGHLFKIPGESLRKQLNDKSLTEEQLTSLMDNFVKLAQENKHVQAGWPNSAYIVSKVGVSALTFIQQRNFDADKGKNIFVNAVHPGYVKTDMTSHKGHLSPAEETKDQQKECGFQGSSTLIFSNCGAKCSKEYACSHIAMTYTGLAVLLILGDDLSRVHRSAIIEGVRALQQEDGSFSATLSGSESDMRFVYCAACICYILNDWSGMDVEKTVQFIKNSISYDCGIGQAPEQESHGGSTFCAVATLSLLGQLETALSPKEMKGLRRWVTARQVDGFQGRPNKPVDTCYSFWVGATLKLLGIYEFVDGDSNRSYIMSTQDVICGGFSKWWDTGADPLHTCLGLGGLSLMGEKELLTVHPALNITMRAYKHLQNVQENWEDE